MKKRIKNDFYNVNHGNCGFVFFDGIHGNFIFEITRVFSNSNRLRVQFDDWD